MYSATIQKIKLLFIFVLLSGCITTEVIETGADVNIVYNPTEPESISIHRSSVPDYNFKEIGTVLVKGNVILEEIYIKMRIAASEKGASAIIGFLLEAERETITTPVVMILPGGGFSVQTITETIIIYVASGTLIKKIE